MKSCKLNREQFMENLYKVNRDFIEGELEIVDDFKGMREHILVKNKYGILKTTPINLLNCKRLNIFNAIDRADYTLKEIKYENHNLYPLIKSIRVEKSKYYLNTVYGEIVSDHTSLLKMNKLSILSATNPSEFWIRRNKDIRKDFENIDYSSAIWESNSVKVRLRCKIHDYAYTQRPSHHTAGIQGCPHCMHQTIMYNENNFKNHESFFKKHCSFLYIIRLRSTTEDFYKVGITAENRINYRISQLKKYYEVSLQYSEKGLTTEMYRLEQKFLSEFKNYKYKPIKHFTGYTECLTVNPVDYYYESYYENLEYEQ